MGFKIWCQVEIEVTLLSKSKMTSLEPNIWKLKYIYGNFENDVPPPPTWHQILKPIRILVTIFISYISRYMHVLNAHKVWRILKDTFDTHFRSRSLSLSRSRCLSHSLSCSRPRSRWRFLGTKHFQNFKNAIFRS